MKYIEMNKRSKNSLFQGGHYLWRGFLWIRQPGLRLFVVIPLILNIFILGSLVYFLQGVVSGWMNMMMSWLPGWLGFLNTLLWIVYSLFVIIALAWSFSTLANIIGAPFYSYLSKLTEQRLTGEGNNNSINWKEFFISIPRSLIRECQKLLYYLPRLLVLVILGLIPGLNLIAMIVWFLFSGWMMAIQYVDYPADNNGQSFSGLKFFLADIRIPALTFGLLVSLGMMVPILNLIVLPAAVCGATCLWVENKSAHE